eukprot:Em0002g1919a
MSTRELQALHATTETNTCKGVSPFVSLALRSQLYFVTDVSPGSSKHSTLPPKPNIIEITAVLCDQMSHQELQALHATPKPTLVKGVSPFVSLALRSQLYFVTRCLTREGVSPFRVPSIEITAVLCDQMSHQGALRSQLYFVTRCRTREVWPLLTCIMKDSLTNSILVLIIEVTAVLCDQMSHQGGVAIAACIMKDSPTKSTLGVDVAVNSLINSSKPLHATPLNQHISKHSTATPYNQHHVKGWSPFVSLALRSQLYFVTRCLTGSSKHSTLPPPKPTHVKVSPPFVSLALRSQLYFWCGYHSCLYIEITAVLCDQMSPREHPWVDVTVKLIDQQLQASMLPPKPTHVKGCLTIRSLALRSQLYFVTRCPPGSSKHSTLPPKPTHVKGVSPFVSLALRSQLYFVTRCRTREHGDQQLYFVTRCPHQGAWRSQLYFVTRCPHQGVKLMINSSKHSMLADHPKPTHVKGVLPFVSSSIEITAVLCDQMSHQGGCVTIRVPSIEITAVLCDQILTGSIEITAVLCDQMSHQGGVAFVTMHYEGCLTNSILGVDVAVKLIDHSSKHSKLPPKPTHVKGCLTIRVPSMEITAVLCDQMSHQGAPSTPSYHLTNTCKGCLTIRVPSIEITAVLCDQMSHQGGVAIDARIGYAELVSYPDPYSRSCGWWKRVMNQLLEGLRSTLELNTFHRWPGVSCSPCLKDCTKRCSAPLQLKLKGLANIGRQVVTSPAPTSTWTEAWPHPMASSSCLLRGQSHVTTSRLGEEGMATCEGKSGAAPQIRVWVQNGTGMAEGRQPPEKLEVCIDVDQGLNLDMNSRQASAAIAIIQGEASLLLAAMRRGSRWGGPSRVEDQDPLIQQLHQLQQRLASVAGVWELNGEFLKPFWFVGTNQTSDEVVLRKIVEVLHTILGAPVGRLLSNESVCELMQSCFRICFEMRLSEEAWGGADDVCSVDQTLHCEEETGEEKNHVTTEGDDENKGTAPEAPPTEEGEEETKQTGEEELDPPPLDAPPTSSLSCVPEKHRSVAPYGLPCVREMLRFLISIINSRDRHNSEALVTIGLNLVCAALECSGPVVCQYQSLLLLIQDGLCRNLCTVSEQLLQHDSFAVFSRALKNCYILFICARQHLKLQLEMFLNILIDLISSENLKCPMDRRELALECVLQFCHVQHFAAEIFVNFDCQLYMSNVFEKPHQSVVQGHAGGHRALQQEGHSAVEHLVKQGGLLSVVFDLVESLRHFLEAFRLPSESPIISRILETFTEHWLCTPFNLMWFEKTNCLNVILGKEEIIMPEEHTGAVKENYRWKWPEAQYWEVATSEYDQDLFLVAWGPTVAAVSYVFDIAEDKNIVQKAIGGFSKCASIAAHYEVTEVFDNLVISLCKFITLLTTPEPPSSMVFTIGINHKVRLSILILFSLAHRHGNILREGWKNMLDCLIVLYKAKLLPESMVEVEDVLHPGGRSLFQKEVPSVRP